MAAIGLLSRDLATGYLFIFFRVKERWTRKSPKKSIFAIPAQAGIPVFSNKFWTPAFA
jgi:hypothetical protein